MTRLISLLVFAGLAAGLFLLPTPDPQRLAALQAGATLREPIHVSGDWRAQIGAGDRVLVPDEAGPPLAGTVEEVEGELLRVSIEGREESWSGGRSDLVHPPLWRALLDSSATLTEDGTRVIRLGGARLVDPSEPVRDPILHGQAREALRRTLRSVLAEERIPYRIEGANRPVPGGADIEVRILPGALLAALDTPGEGPRVAEIEWRLPTRESLLPPLLAILLAILFRRPVLALFAGVYGGAFLLQFGAGADPLPAAGGGLLAVFQTYLWSEVVDSERQKIILFVLFMLAMVGVMTRAGGIRGLMDVISRLASSVRRTQIATWLMGLTIFFDDYANTILVGTTMRPLTDRFKIAREKLAYIVDSTAAPVAGLSIFSTWIAFEVSTFSAQLPDVGLTVGDGYRVFLETLPMRFYCIFTLILVALIVLTGRDFGPMLAAERRARGGLLVREGGQPLVGSSATELEPSPRVRPAMSRALLPILTFIAVTLAWICWKGGVHQLTASEIFSIQGLAKVLYDGDSFTALMVGSGAGFLLACVLAVGAGIAREVPRAAWNSLRSMAIAIAILYLAWMIGAVCRDLGTAPYLTVLVGERLNALLLPSILFALSGLVAFATGSSWSTMTILLPIVVGLAFNLGEQTDAIGGYTLMLLSIGAVLEGSIFGDHCSPISDTTVMSSIASASDHIDHVRTQAPYAIVTMVVAMLAGYFPCTFLGISPWLGLVVGASVLVAIVFYAGRRAEQR